MKGKMFGKLSWIGKAAGKHSRTGNTYFVETFPDLNALGMLSRAKLSWRRKALGKHSQTGII